jgi:hypothetical protein
MCGISKQEASVVNIPQCWLGTEVWQRSREAVCVENATVWDIIQCSPLKSTDMSEEHVSFTFSFKE